MSTPASHKVRVVVRSWQGHQLHYVREIARAADSASVEIELVVDSAALTSPQLQSALGTNQLHMQPIDDFESLGLFGQLRFLREHVTPKQPTLILDAEYWLLAILLARLARLRGEVRLQVTREPLIDRQLGPRSRIANVIKAALLAICGLQRSNSVFILKSPLFDCQGPARWLIARKLAQALVDPPLTSASRTPMAATDRHKAVGVFGNLDDPRKSVLELIRLWTEDSELHGHLLLLAGMTSADSEIRRKAARAQAIGVPIELVPRYLTQQELIDTIDRCSAVLCISQTDIPSGLAILAMSRGRPVIAFSMTRLGVAVDQLGLGAAAHLNKLSLKRALDRCAILSSTTILETFGDLQRSEHGQGFGDRLLGC